MRERAGVRVDAHPAGCRVNVDEMLIDIAA
jgi:hypothetical protein